jgi:hypothetical protein
LINGAACDVSEKHGRRFETLDSFKETQPFQVALTSSPFQVSSVCLSVCLSALGVKTRPARQLTCRKGLPLPPCCQTRASSPPIRRQPHVHRRLVLLLPPPARLSCRLFSLSQPTLPTTTTTTARRCLYHLVHASFDVANGLSYFHLTHSLFHSNQTPSGWTPDTPHSPQHQPYPHSLDALRPFTTIEHHTHTLPLPDITRPHQTTTL